VVIEQMHRRGRKYCGVVCISVSAWFAVSTFLLKDLSELVSRLRPPQPRRTITAIYQLQLTGNANHSLSL
jgi:hypothetical protein